MASTTTSGSWRGGGQSTPAPPGHPSAGSRSTISRRTAGSIALNSWGSRAAMDLAPPSCPGTRSFCKARESWHGRIIVRAATVPDLLRDAAREASAAEAFRYRDERLTYGDWDTLADRVAAGLAARGVRRGD